MKLYGLIGKPLGHSFSKEYFTQKFRREGLECAYNNYELASIAELPALLMVNPQLEGLNVTSPYKEAILPYLTSLSEEARRIGAVNVVKIVRDEERNVKELIGFNSDYYGFKGCLEPFCFDKLQTIVCGNGGASKAANAVLEDLGFNIIRVGRRKNGDSISYTDLTAEMVTESSLIINATPLGMAPHLEESPNLPYRYINHSHICIDMVYNPRLTPFLNKCLESGATVRNGLCMLLRQAERSWEIWQCEHPAP